MTVTETRSTSADSPNGHGDTAPTLSDQVVMSSAAVTSQGFSTMRRIAGDAVTTVDRAVLGGFDIAGQLARSSMLSDIASKSVEIGRETWSAGVEATHRLLNEV